MARAIDLDKAIEIIEEKQKELCPVGRYGRNYVYGSDREKYDDWEEIIDALEHLSTLTPPNEPLTLEELREMGGQPYWHVGLREESPPPHWNILDPFCAKRIEDYKYGENWIAYRRPPEGEDNETK